MSIMAKRGKCFSCGHDHDAMPHWFEKVEKDKRKLAAAMSRINALMEEAQEQAKDHLDSLGVIDRLNSEKAALLEEVEGLRKDAERYRWLRLNVNDKWEMVFDDCGRDMLQTDALDAAIDAAMSSGRSGSGDGGMG